MVVNTVGIERHCPQGRACGQPGEHRGLRRRRYRGRTHSPCVIAVAATNVAAGAPMRRLTLTAACMFSVPEATAGERRADLGITEGGAVWSATA